MEEWKRPGSASFPFLSWDVGEQGGGETRQTVRKRTWNQAAAPTKRWIFQHLDLRFPNLCNDEQCNNNAFMLLEVTQSVAFGIAASGD